MLPSGDQCGLLSEMSGVLVRFTTWEPSLETANKSYSPPPPKSCSKTMDFPSGDQTAPDCRSSDCKSWIGNPPADETFHRFARPVRLVVNTTSRPSGDHAAPYVFRVQCTWGIVTGPAAALDAAP